MKDLRKLIADKGISQAELARILKVARSTMCLYVSGERKFPCDKLPLLAHTLGCTIDDLFEKE